MSFSQFTIKSVDEVFESLKSRDSGLTEKEVEDFQKAYGVSFPAKW